MSGAVTTSARVVLSLHPDIKKLATNVPPLPFGFVTTVSVFVGEVLTVIVKDVLYNPLSCFIVNEIDFAGMSAEVMKPLSFVKSEVLVGIWGIWLVFAIVSEGEQVIGMSE